MKNNHQKISIIDRNDDWVDVQFLDSGMTMPMSANLLKDKLQSGLYQLIEKGIVA